MKKKLVRLWLITFCVLAIGCSKKDSDKDKKNGKVSHKEQEELIVLADEVSGFEDLKYGDYKKLCPDVQPTYVHSVFYSVPAFGEVKAVYEGEFDRSLNQSVLKDESRLVRLEGTVGDFFGNYVGALTPDEFTSQLVIMREPREKEGNATVYYVSEKYIEFSYDDPILGEVFLLIDTNSGKYITSKTKCWLLFEL